MCFSHCPQQTLDGTCNGHFPHACTVEEASIDARTTGMICPVCLGRGEDHMYLVESDGDSYECPRCEQTLPAAEWMMLYAECLGEVFDTLKAAEADNAVLRADCFQQERAVQAVRSALEQAGAA